jgi:branched-chain amino acid transport system permease protein
MEAFIAQLINGVKMGGIYSVAVLGYNLLLLTTGIFHMGYASLLVLSMYALWLALGATSNNIVLSIVIAIASGIVISSVIAPFFAPFIKRKGAELESSIVSLAIGTIAVEIMSHWLNHGLPVAFPQELLLEGLSINFGVTNIRGGEIVGLVGSIIIVIAFFNFLRRTKLGRVLRAVAQNSAIARLLGISVPRTAAISFMLGGLLAGLAAVLLTISVGSATPSLGDGLMFECLAILFLAGVGNLKGGVICAIILGIIESLAMGYLPGDWTNAIAFSVVVLVLLFKPGGIFGHQT